MKTIRILSVIGLAGFLVLQGVYYLSEAQSPTIHALVGALGLASGALMFISLGHWIDFNKEK